MNIQEFLAQYQNWAPKTDDISRWSGGQTTPGGRAVHLPDGGDGGSTMPYFYDPQRDVWDALAKGTVTGSDFDSLLSDKNGGLSAAEFARFSPEVQAWARANPQQFASELLRNANKESGDLGSMGAEGGYSNPELATAGAGGMDFSNAGYMAPENEFWDSQDFWGPIIVGGAAAAGGAGWLGGSQTGAGTGVATTGAEVVGPPAELAGGAGSTAANAGNVWNSSASLAENLGLPQASFAAPAGATPIYSTLPGGVEGITAYQLANGAVVSASDLALGAGVTGGLIGGAGAAAGGGILDRLGNSVSNLFGNGSGGTGLDMKDLFQLAKTGTGIYSLINANNQADKTNNWQQGQVPQGTNMNLTPTMPGGALGQIAGMTPQNWQSKIGYADGGVVRPGMDKPSIMGFLQYLYNSKKLPSELAQEKQKKREGDVLQRGIAEVTSPTNALDRRMKEMNLKAGGPLSLVRGSGAGQDDAIPARLSDGEYVFDADVVAALGDGSTDAGAAKLDRMREKIRTHKRKASPKKIPPKAKDPMAYLGGK